MADTKLSALATVTPLATDLVYLVRTSLGTSGSKGAPISALSTLIGVTAFPDIADVAGVSVTVGVPTFIAGSTATPASLTASGANADISLKLSSKGLGFLQLGPDTYGVAGWAGYNVITEAVALSGTEMISYGHYVEVHGADVVDASSIGVVADIWGAGAAAVNNNDGISALRFTAHADNPSGTNYVYGIVGQSYAHAGAVDNVYGASLTTGAFTGGVIATTYGVKVGLQDQGTAVGVGVSYGYHASMLFTQAIASNYGFYATDAAGTATNAYYFWADSRGVYRIREDNVVDPGNAQAVTALYNPRFTKYTAGAADYERIVQQWDTNVAEIGVEVGGTGTNRALRLLGASFQFNSVAVDFGAGGTVLYSGGAYVASITGTANQVIASAATGAVTLSLPQSIGTASAVTFGGLTLNGTFLQTSASATAWILGPNGATNPTAVFVTNVASAVTGLKFTSQVSGSGFLVESTGSAANENIFVVPNGTGKVGIGTAAFTPLGKLSILGPLTQLAIHSTAGTGLNSSHLIGFYDSAGTRQAYIYKEATSGKFTFINESSVAAGNVSISFGAGGADRVLVYQTGAVYIPGSSTGSLRIGQSTTGTYQLQVDALNGTANLTMLVKDAKATTGSTLARFEAGAGQSTNPIVTIHDGTNPIHRFGSDRLGFFGATMAVQGASIADPAGGGTVDAECRTAVAALITRLETFGLIATV